MPVSECWTIIWIIADCLSLLSFDECHFLPEIELQQEGAARGVSNILTIDIRGCPFERSVGGNGLAELSTDDGNCVFNVVAELVKLGSFELML
jgi:hypothetical protein